MTYNLITMSVISQYITDFVLDEQSGSTSQSGLCRIHPWHIRCNVLGAVCKPVIFRGAKHQHFPN